MSDLIDAVLFIRGEGIDRCRIRAFHSSVFSARMIDPRGAWRVQVFPEGEESVSCHLGLTDEQRTALVHALGGVIPEDAQP
jgi:endonuclease/exonuclease/phosphatase family metal-dependent hydrolase